MFDYNIHEKTTNKVHEIIELLLFHRLLNTRQESQLKQYVSVLEYLIISDYTLRADKKHFSGKLCVNNSFIYSIQGDRKRVFSIEYWIGNFGNVMWWARVIVA